MRHTPCHRKAKAPVSCLKTRCCLRDACADGWSLADRARSRMRSTTTRACDAHVSTLHLRNPRKLSRLCRMLAGLAIRSRLLWCRGTCGGPAPTGRSTSLRTSLRASCHSELAEEGILFEANFLRVNVTVIWACDFDNWRRPIYGETGGGGAPRG